MADAAAKRLKDIFAAQDGRKATYPDVRGRVDHVDASGTAWVSIPGNDELVECSAPVKVISGDDVTVRMVAGVLTAAENHTHPVTDDALAAEAIGYATAAREASERANEAATQAAADAASAAISAADAAESASDAQADARTARDSATAATADAAAAATSAGNAETSARNASSAASEAQSQAQAATTAAQQAQSQAQAANTAANEAKADASTARQSAEQATIYSNAALDQLGVVQDVIGVLDWASSHGTFTKTSDTAIQGGKVYFTYDSTTGDYTPVVEPQASQLSNYYELSMTEAMNDFILAHLAVTSRGLWVLPSGKGSATSEQNAPGYKVLLSNSGMTVYDGSGVLVTKYGESITFDSERPQRIGNDTAYIEYYDSDNDGRPDSIRIVGTNLNTEMVSKDGVIAAINLSTETEGGSAVKIHADKVNIEGAAIFTSGRLSQSSLNSAYDAAGSASAAQAAAISAAASDATSKANAAEANAKAAIPTDISDLNNDAGYQTSSDVSAAISTGTANLAAKADAVARTQRIYYRQTASGSAPGVNNTWLSTSGTGYGNWSLSIPQLTNGTTNYPKLYMATQTQTVAQKAAGTTCSCTTPALDDSTTIIDGGSIVTGTIDASKATITNINGANITAGTLSIGQVANLQDTLNEMESNLTDEISQQSAAAFDVSEKIQGQVTAIREGLLTSTYFVQDGDSYTFNLLETAIDGLTGDLEEISSYVRIETEDGSPVLKLGSSEAPVYAALSNSALEFRTQAGDVIAYFLVEDGVGKLKIDNAVILQELQFGDWKWTPRANGNLSLMWIGA